MFTWQAAHFSTRKSIFADRVSGSLRDVTALRRDHVGLHGLVQLARAGPCSHSYAHPGRVSPLGPRSSGIPPTQGPEKSTLGIETVSPPDPPHRLPVYSEQYTVHGTQYALHSIQYTGHSTQYTVCIVQYTVHGTQYAVKVYRMHHRVHSTQYTVLCKFSVCIPAFLDK
jgi:hypothetical protein